MQQEAQLAQTLLIQQQNATMIEMFKTINGKISIIIVFDLFLYNLDLNIS